jgi:signal transduction histidine kinase
MKTELVNVVSHELRTPLTAIRNALFLLGGTKLGSLSPGQNRFVDLAKRNVEQLIGIINDLLDLSKIEAGKMHLELAPTSMAQEIENALASLQPQAEAKGVSLQWTIAPNLPPVFGHAASIQRVMVNLVGNAIKFTDRGGVVKVESTRAGSDEVAGEAGAVRVTVSDSGVGIPKDQLESIFEKFHQVEADEKTRTAPGTGLGLSISRELVKAHHGRIWAESETGSGSRFSFVIPILSQKELLMRALSSEVARASELEGPLALVVGRLQGAYAVRARSEEEYERAVDDLLAMTRKLVRRSSDLVLARRDAGEVVVILPRAPRDGGVAFANRLAEEMAKDAATDSTLLLKVAAAQYPEDGRSAEELYHAALEKIGEIVAA